METALTLFYSRGCRAVTMDEIASEAGISKRTLYEQFADKEALLEGGIRWWNEQNRKKIEVICLGAENTLDILLRIHRFQSEQMVKISIDLISDLKKFYPLVFKNTILVTKEHHKERTKSFLIRGQSEDVFRSDINIDLISEFFELMFFFIHENNKALIQKYSYEEFFRSTAGCFIRGIATEQGLKYLDKHYM
jgi:AcrR family transcriptional regulator